MTMSDDGAVMSAEELAEAIRLANIPTLLMVLVHMTGDQRWLSPEYQPTRSRGLDDNDTGGLPPSRQGEVRAAALDAISAWLAGTPLALPHPDEDLLLRMLNFSAGEEIPSGYGALIRSELAEGLGNTPTLRIPLDFHYIIIGAGVSGICAGAALTRAGADFVVFERNASVGGTWLENAYPGAGVDTPNHLYSFSFAPHDWTHYFALQEEIRGYLEDVARDHGVLPHIRFQTTVRSVRWLPERSMWEVTVQESGGPEQKAYANVVLSAVGAFAAPRIPDIPGLREFPGPVFHTARWPHSLDLTGKRVAVIGNGASAMQVVPAIVESVSALTIFQRSAHWVAPFDKFQQRVPDALRRLMSSVPIYRIWYRIRLGWNFNDRLHASLQKDPTWPHPERSVNAQNDAYRRYFTQYLESELGDRADLIAKALPDYPAYGKRMLLDNGWFRALRNEKTILVDESVAEVCGKEIVTADGMHYEADVLVVATGFEATRFLHSYDVIGRDGISIRDAWQDDNCAALLGTTVPGYPNFFILYGPNLQPGHGGSYMFIAEAQVHYIMSLLSEMDRLALAEIECLKSSYDAFNSETARRHDSMIWTHPGMSTYYRNARGRVIVATPYRIAEFWEITRTHGLTDYCTSPRRDEEHPMPRSARTRRGM
jgi:4-hydroxyacetophenone monooxygenase